MSDISHDFKRLYNYQIELRKLVLSQLDKADVKKEKGTKLKELYSQLYQDLSFRLKKTEVNKSLKGFYIQESEGFKYGVSDEYIAKCPIDGDIMNPDYKCFKKQFNFNYLEP